ncbi:Cd(II)/Pb(II)-responsive transcriptional regulator [Pokkaliibacter sp. CJK22405]|uniref:Cd(II)/Pb(II)-responsive transcriptional regulator n=1 Tax=Pokkaliibacter sp. CJK22405 TaxID=3384615 RepID=UPI0039851263
MSVQEYKIGELSSLTDCPVETIRYYEKQGLLPAPGRNQANYRVYGPTHLKRLQFILHCRALDMAQEEIRQLVDLQERPEAPCTEVDALLDEHLTHVEARIQQLSHLRDVLRDLRRQCDNLGPVSECAILDQLEQRDFSEASSQQDAHLGHVHGSHHN